MMNSMTVALKWGLILKSFNQGRLKENMPSFNLKLNDQDLLEIDKLKEKKIMRGEFLVNGTRSPYKTIDDLCDGEI
ncbi:hypothetical protein SLA2020_144150 [Shorea laevis]